MLSKENNTIISNLQKLIVSEKTSPYVFRTRLERILYEINHNSILFKNIKIINLYDSIMIKLKCLSDQSNQTPDGTLNSYLFLKNDLNELLNELLKYQVV